MRSTKYGVLYSTYVGKTRLLIMSKQKSKSADMFLTTITKHEHKKTRVQNRDRNRREMFIYGPE